MVRTPFKLGQPVDEVLYIMRRTGRQRLAVEFTGKEGTFIFDLRKRKGKRRIERELQSELAQRRVDLTQNFTVMYFLSDCTLAFKKYRGLDGNGSRCYRIIKVSEPFDDLDTLFPDDSPVVHTPSSPQLA